MITKLNLDADGDNKISKDVPWTSSLCPPASQKPGKKPKGPKKRVICRCSRWWFFSHFFFHFHSYLRSFSPILTFAAYFLKKWLGGWKNHQRIVIFRVLGARGFALQNLPETLGIFSSKTSQWQTFLAVFLTGKLEDFLVFFFFLLGQSRSYIFTSYMCMYIYIQML